MNIFSRALFAVALCAAASSALAQAWPARPIKLIVPNAAGSATDTMARLLANDVGRALGPGMVVENVAGPQGLTGHQAAARAEPDGYTFLFTNTSGLAGNLVSFKQLPYDPVKDFVAVAMVCNLGPQLVSVNADTPYKTLGDILAAAKAKPGDVSVALDATVGAGIIATRMLAKRTGVDMPQVPYRSPAQMAPDVAQGRVPVMMSSIAVANPFLETKQIRPIAVTSAKRFPGMPETPTLAETVPEVVIDGWFVVVAPKGVPEPIIRRVNAAIGEFLKGEDIRKRLIAIGLATEGAGTPESTGEYISMQQARWREIAKEINLEAQ
jgi:tripartite-type tricarboxylate transporter receptor subunit TctC